MLTILEILMIAANIPVLIWALLPVKKVPRFLDYLPSSAVLFLILHLFIDTGTVRARFMSLYLFVIAVFLLTIKRLFRHNPDQPKRRVMAVINRIFGIVALTFSVLVPTVVLPFNPLPEPTGSFNVGTVTCGLTDSNRIETFSKEAGKPREIAVQFWYPTDRTGAEMQYDINGAPVSASQESYPVVIFSHGAFGVRMSNASAFRELASHGYIVASIDHTYHSFYTAFPDGKKVPISMEFLNNAVGVQTNQMPLDETFTVTHEWLKLRTDDVKFVLDSLESGKLGPNGEFLNGHMDLDRIGLFGHSLGGAASAQVARERDDVKAAIVIDGTMIGDITGMNSDQTDILTDESFNKPLMLMYGSLFFDPQAKATSYQSNIKAYDTATDAAYSLCIKDSGHLNFTDLPRISPFLSGMLGIGTADSYKCIKIVNDYSLAFFDRHLKGQASPLLDDATLYSEVVFEKRIPAGK